VSVDTYLRGKNLDAYRTFRLAGDDDEPIKVLVSQKMATWSRGLAIGIRKFLIWESFDIKVIPVHTHAPGIT
jgi:hypothetical protein